MRTREREIRTLEDGTIVESQFGYAKYTHTDGTVHEHFIGGYEQIVRADKTRINKWPSGHEYTYHTDGTTTVKHPDGRVETLPATAKTN